MNAGKLRFEVLCPINSAFDEYFCIDAAFINELADKPVIFLKGFEIDDKGVVEGVFYNVNAWNFAWIFDHFEIEDFRASIYFYFDGRVDVFPFDRFLTVVEKI